MTSDQPPTVRHDDTPVEYDPAKLEAAMRELKQAIIILRREFKEGTAPAPKQEARAAIREKARTGALKPVRTPAPAATGPMGPRATGPVRAPTAPQASRSAPLRQPEPPTGPLAPSGELEAVEGWVSLSDLAAQNHEERRAKQRRQTEGDRP